MGSLLAGLLAARPEAEVWLVGSASSASHLGVIEQTGLLVQIGPGVAETLPSLSLTKPWLIQNLQITTNPEEAFPCDMAIVLVKSYRTDEAARQVRRLLAANGLALTLQNGLGNFEILAAEVGLERAAQGVTTLAATLVQPGLVRWSGGGPISLGLNPAHLLLLNAFTALFQALNLSVTFTENIVGLVWGKLVINCAINPLGALLNVPNGELLKRPAALELLVAAASEAATVARACGIILPYDYDAAAYEACQVAQRTASNINSMLSDVRRGRPTEIGAINEAVVREGQRLGVSVLINETLARLIRALVSTPL